MKEIGKLWAHLNEEERSVYAQIANKDKQRYAKQLQQIAKLKEQNRFNNEEIDKPKKCLSAYMIFVRET